MKFSRNIFSSLRLSLAAIVATFAFSSNSFAQSGAIDPTAGLPLDKTASRGIVTRDPSDIVKCGDEYWVFYTGQAADGTAGLTVSLTSPTEVRSVRARGEVR